MIQMMTAFTTEVDEIDDALNEILGQLNLGALKKNSAGIITCHSDFADSGLIEALAERLPFDTIGATTMASANAHGMSMYGGRRHLCRGDHTRRHNRDPGICPASTERS